MFFTACFLFREAYLRGLIGAEKPSSVKSPASSKIHSTKKLTLEENFRLLKEIQRKAEAARILEKIPDAHFNVFQSCNEYLSVTEKELQKISANSPRLSPILRGRSYVMKLRKYHLLAWAELEAKSLIESLKAKKTTKDKLRSAEKAVEKLNFALSYYPQEACLIDSISAIRDIIISIKVSELTKKAEKAFSENQISEAIRHYERAMEQLQDSTNPEKKLLLENIKSELEKLLSLKRSGEKINFFKEQSDD